MNSSFAMEPFAQDNLLVTISLILVGLLAIITIIGMVWGARLKRRRKEAEVEEQTRIDELRAAGVEPSNTASNAPQSAVAAPTTAPAPAPVIATPPVAPAPPPLDASPAPGTPPLADEPIAAAAPLDASPATLAADTPAAPVSAQGNTSITMLKGLGPRIAARLAELGITDVEQLAWLDDAEAQALDAQLGAFQGRMERDRWREQARLLAQGDRAGFEAQFGKLG